MQPTFEEKPAFQVAGVINRGQPAELNFEDIWSNQYMPLDESIKAYSPDKGYFGIWFYPEEEQSYLAGMAVEGLAAPPQGAVIREVPGHLYAVFTCSMATIPQAYKAAYEEWLPQSEYEMDSTGCDFEYYPPGSEALEATALLYIPLKKKG
jgi:predicted transcriptional regulator YdeE